MWITGDFQQTLSKLVLIGEPAGSPPPQQGKVRNVNKYENPSFESMRKYYEAILVADVSRVASEMLEEELAATRLPGADVAWNTMLEQIRNEKKGLTYSMRPELKNLQPPTLFIWGDKDWFGPPSLGEEMAAIAPHALCKTVPDAGHLAWLDQPGRCAELTLDFLKS